MGTGRLNSPTLTEYMLEMRSRGEDPGSDNEVEVAGAMAFLAAQAIFHATDESLEEADKLVVVKALAGFVYSTCSAVSEVGREAIVASLSEYTEHDDEETTKVLKIFYEVANNSEVEEP